MLMGLPAVGEEKLLSQKASEGCVLNVAMREQDFSMDTVRHKEGSMGF
ncbi:hypothetical protein NRIC_21640 [Enterococcus florum]|uniref:Uncharacterized protein n=1 Tax=Enterococcus florum TaxID=2480627 RepID=A0A4P5PLZ5_9ENTE|nr:hypothetical protein [Enterococcus florum]GCF94273.1 hypothetical protein NRIC_21640 [Enterococcus florum]